MYVGTLPWCGCTGDVFPLQSQPSLLSMGARPEAEPSTAKPLKLESPRALPVLPSQNRELACSLTAPVQEGVFPQWFVLPQDTGRSLSEWDSSHPGLS